VSRLVTLVENGAPEGREALRRLEAPPRRAAPLGRA